MSHTPVKVLFAASTFPRWSQDELPDFVWQQVRHVAAGAPDLRAYVLAPHHAGAARLERWEGVEVRRFRYLWPERLQRLAYPAIWPNLERSPWLWLQVPLLLAAEFVATLRWTRRERFSLIYSHWFVPQGVACGLAALLTGTPHAFTSHSSDVLVMRRLPWLGSWLVRFLTRRAHRITTVSQRSLSHLRSFFDEEGWREIAPRVRVLPMGVSTSEWGAPEEMGAEESKDPPTILFLGRLVPKKGVEHLLDALALEPLRAMGAALVIAGDGPSRENLEKQVASLGLGERVDFVGYVGGDLKRTLLHEADVVALPSIVTPGGDAEGIPVVLLEALAAGRICVASDASGAPEVLSPGEDGFLVPAGDAQALSVALAEALRLPAAQRRRISAKALETARAYDWTRVARAHVEHLVPRS